MGSTIEIIEKILDRWEELREGRQGDLLAEDVVLQDEGLQRLVADQTHLLSEANEKIEKLRRFDAEVGIGNSDAEPHFDAKTLEQSEEKLHTGL